MTVVDHGRWPAAAPGQSLWAAQIHDRGESTSMTAAAAAIASSSAAPRLIGTTAAAAVLAFAATLVGFIVAPIAVLGVAVAALVIVGMVEIGRSVDRTFQSLTELGG